MSIHILFRKEITFFSLVCLGNWIRQELIYYSFCGGKFSAWQIILDFRINYCGWANVNLACFVNKRSIFTDIQEYFCFPLLLIRKQRVTHHTVKLSRVQLPLKNLSRNMKDYLNYPLLPWQLYWVCQERSEPSERSDSNSSNGRAKSTLLAKNGQFDRNWNLSIFGKI